MIGPSTSLPDRLVFTYRQDEAMAYMRLIASRQDQGPDAMNFEALIVALALGIGLVVLFANHLGLVDSSEMAHVLFTAYAAFAAGAFIYRAVMRARLRAIARTVFHKSEFGTETFEMEFGDRGVSYDSPKSQMLVPWRAIAQIIEFNSVVVLMYEPFAGLPIPVRLFADPASRAGFIAAVRERSAESGASTRPSDKLAACDMREKL